MLQDRNFYIGIAVGAVLVYWYTGRRATAAAVVHPGG